MAGGSGGTEQKHQPVDTGMPRCLRAEQVAVRCQKITIIESNIGI
jgi:hypothetical protein